MPQVLREGALLGTGCGQQHLRAEVLRAGAGGHGSIAQFRDANFASAEDRSGRFLFFPPPPFFSCFFGGLCVFLFQSWVPLFVVLLKETEGTTPFAASPTKETPMWAYAFEATRLLVPSLRGETKQKENHQCWGSLCK